MQLVPIAITFAVVASLAVPTLAQEDAVNVPGPITFESTDFDLVWTSHPTPAYYKQEYLPQGEAVESYSQMFMVDVLTEGATPETAAADMIAGLEQRKADDPVVNYAMVSNDATGELILDFLISDTSTGTVIIEWNAYRYVPHGDGFALFAISRRGYDDEALDFIAGVKQMRSTAIQSLASMELPLVVVD